MFEGGTHSGRRRSWSDDSGRNLQLSPAAPAHVPRKLEPFIFSPVILLIEACRRRQHSPRWRASSSAVFFAAFHLMASGRGRQTAPRRRRRRNGREISSRVRLSPVPFRTQICRRLRARLRCWRDFNKNDLPSGADNAVPDQFLEMLSRLLEEAGTFPDDGSPPDEVLWVLEENAHLRALAVTLSNALGDLPEKEWQEPSTRT
jgi:hypothetical protein